MQYKVLLLACDTKEITDRLPCARFRFPATAETLQEWDFCCQYDKISSEKVEGYTGSVVKKTKLSVNT